MGLITKLAWVALPAFAGCGMMSQVSSQGLGTNPGGKATGSFESDPLQSLLMPQPNISLNNSLLASIGFNPYELSEHEIPIRTIDKDGQKIYVMADGTFGGWKKMQSAANAKVVDIDFPSASGETKSKALDLGLNGAGILESPIFSLNTGAEDKTEVIRFVLKGKGSGDEDKVELVRVNTDPNKPKFERLSQFFVPKSSAFTTDTMDVSKLSGDSFAIRITSAQGGSSLGEIVAASNRSALSALNKPDSVRKERPLTAYDRVDFNAQYEQGMMDSAFQSRVKNCVQQIVDQNGVVGATGCVVVDGKLRATFAIGERKLGSRVPIQVEDPMHIGSNAKGMTALVFARLVEQGKVKFDSTLGEILGDSFAGNFANVRMIDLLRQRSGMADENVPSQFDKKYMSIASNDYVGKGFPSIEKRLEARALYAKDCLQSHPSYPVDSQMKYANANYIVLGHVIDVVGGGSWEELIQKELFTPMHMKVPGFGPMGKKDDVSAPWQHRRVAGGEFNPVYADGPVCFAPAGTVHCSALDLANYGYFRTVGAYSQGAYLSPNTWSFLHTPGKGTGYASGIAVSGPDSRGVRDMSHGGSNLLSCSDWWVREHGRVVIVSMINCQSPEANEKILRNLEALTKEYAN